ncbi:MAG: Cof-type HAD-IIB family hydrolase [Limosilactobacillus reuteri]
MTYRYVAVDVDGTLLDDHDHYNRQRLATDIKKLAQLGITFIIASGNSLDALQNLFPRQLVNNYVAENGGRIIVDGQEHFNHPHQAMTVQALLKYVTTQLPAVDLLSVSGASRTFIPQRFNTVPVPYYPHHAYFRHWAEINEPVYNVNVNWYRQKLPPARINQIVDQLNQAFPDVNATYSGAYGIDILPQGVNKAAGLQKFISLTAGSLKELVAIGDTSNDIEMVSAAGLGIAMRNATADLKAVADRITALDNNHDGLLNELESLFS